MNYFCKHLLVSRLSEGSPQFLWYAVKFWAKLHSMMEDVSMEGGYGSVL